ncbi:hypothetical protein [Hyphobacterium indicum]|uniref:hypothetical protein n=1 Tax=Hyphobacterium indicum TaxID=2162714 RepID=UPI000F6434AA|nr:hypothetical protein [Hyphobacterium indicum]
MTPHPALKLARPSIFLGGLMAVAGALLVTGRIEIANGLIIGIIVLCLGIGGVIFGLFVQAAWRIVVAANSDTSPAQTEEQE